MSRVLLPSALLAACLVAGCGGEEEPSTSPPTQNPSPAPENSPLASNTGASSNTVAGGPVKPAPPVAYGANSHMAGGGLPGAAGDGTGVNGTEPSADQLLNQAITQYRAGNLAGASETAEKFLEKEPNSPQGLMLLAQVNHVRASNTATGGDRMGANPFFYKAADAMRQLREANPELTANERSMLATTIYNEACCLAIEGKTEEAIDSLNEALDQGFSDFQLLNVDAATFDSDLVSLRDKPGFEGVLSKVKEKQAEFAHAEEEARAALAKTSIDEAKRALAENKPFDLAFQLPRLEGETLSLDDLKGKVVVVDFWGTWCPPCRAEIPHFVELKEKYADKGFEIVGINYERVPEDQVKETIQKYAKETGINYPLVIGDDATRDQVPDFIGYPTTVFLDRSGKVRAKIVGGQSKEFLEALITSLLDESAPEGKGDAE